MNFFYFHVIHFCLLLPFFIGSGSGGRGCKAGLVSVKIVNIQKEQRIERNSS